MAAEPSLMEPRSLEYLAEAAGGQVVQPEESLLEGVSLDSRTCRPGELFVAIKGDRFDGHDYLKQASERGASAALVEEGRIPEGWGGGLITVENTRAALLEMGRKYREDFSIPVVAVGGSNGKTSTKNLIGHLLSASFPTLFSESSFNNDIGVPLTLLRLEKKHRAAVVEVGTNHPGELRPLLETVQPTLGVLTSIGREHLEFFLDLNGVMKEEGVLAEMIPATGAFFFCGDDPRCRQLAGRTDARAVSVGFAEGNSWRVKELLPTEKGIGFILESPHQDWNGFYQSPFFGRHQLPLALLALAVAAESGADPQKSRKALPGFRGTKMRLEIRRMGKSWLLDDSYNANAESTLAALQTLRDLPFGAKKIAALGDMAELGPETEQCHLEVGRAAALLKVDYLIAIGRHARLMATGAREAGLSEVEVFDDPLSAAQKIRSLLGPEDVLLIKASRSSRLEQITQYLQEEKS